MSLSLVSVSEAVWCSVVASCGRDVAAIAEMVSGEQGFDNSFDAGCHAAYTELLLGCLSDGVANAGLSHRA